MTDQPVGPHCGNNPNVQLTDGDRRAVEEFKAHLAERAATRDRIVEVLTTTSRAEWPYTPGHEKWDHHKHDDRPGHSYSISCALCTGDVERLADVLLAAGVVAVAADQTEPVCKFDEGCHRVVPCDPGCGTRDLLAEALAAGQPAGQTERLDRYAAAMAKRDGDTWPTQYEDDEADYRRRAEQAEELLAVANETSNRSEAERARAVQRAERAEVAIERVRVEVEEAEHHRQQTHASERTDCVMCGSGHMADVRAALDTAEPAAAPAVDRATVLREAADVLETEGKRLTGEFNDSDILHEDGPAAAVATWKRAADRLRRLADEAQQQPGAHVYLSTGCLHGQHGYCQADTGKSGAKTPSVCKWCPAKCVCPCHHEETQQPAVVPCVRPDTHPAHLHSGLRKGVAVHGRCPGVPATQQPAVADTGEEPRP
jgi:hypothetical protein